MAAAVVMGSLNIRSHLEKGRLLLSIILPLSYLSDEKSEENLHLLSRLLNVTKVINDDGLIPGQLL